MAGVFATTLFVIAVWFFHLVTAQNASTSGPSARIFMPTAYENTIKFAASVIGVCHERTTYGVRCTSGILASGRTCGPEYPEATITEDAASYIATKTTPFSSAILTETETCSLKGTTEATCSARIVIAGTKSTVTTSTTSTLSGTDIPDFYMYQIPVTAGIQNLHVSGNACTGSASGIWPPVAGACTLMAFVLLVVAL